MLSPVSIGPNKVSELREGVAKRVQARSFWRSSTARRERAGTPFRELELRTRKPAQGRNLHPIRTQVGPRAGGGVGSRHADRRERDVFEAHGQSDQEIKAGFGAQFEGIKFSQVSSAEELRPIEKPFAASLTLLTRTAGSFAKAIKPRGTRSRRPRQEF